MIAVSIEQEVIGYIVVECPRIPELTDSTSHTRRTRGALQCRMEDSYTRT